MHNQSVLFVCHGNICRSVMAEMMLRQMLAENGFSHVEVASCATSTEEIGNDIYPPARRCLLSHHVPITPHRARQIADDDLLHYDLIFAMDDNNIRNLTRMFGPLPEKVHLLLDRNVADPWYTGDFEVTYRDLTEGCRKIMTLLTK